MNSTINIGHHYTLHLLVMAIMKEEQEQHGPF